VSAVHAGRFDEARAAFVESLKHQPHNATVYLWLAGIAPSEREAYQLLDRARRLDPKHPHLELAAEGIHEHFAKRRSRLAATGGERDLRRVGLDMREVRTAATALGLEDLLSRRAAGVLLGLVSRLISTVLTVIALVFFVALLAELGKAGGLQKLPSAVPSAATFATDYLKGLLRGDMGIVASSRLSLTGESVVAELRRALPLSLGLLATALTLAAFVGIALGAGAALLRASRFSAGLLFVSVLGISTPSFFAAMLLIWLGLWLYQTTGTHFFPLAGFGWDAHLVLPALVLAARPAATVTRLSYNKLVEVLEADYIRTAKAKGLGPRVVLLRHVLRNAGVPLLTTIAVSLRFSLAILPVVEYIFNWPGIARILLTAVQIQDTTTVVGMTLPLVLLFVLANLILELCYPLIDPRLQDSEGGVV
jgi:peptide/nickel transport system permease protein